MKTNSTRVFVCTTALTGALALGSSLAACRSSDGGNDLSIRRNRSSTVALSCA